MSLASPPVGPIAPMPRLDLPALRASVPALHQQIDDRPLVYLDNAATTLKPQAVIDAVTSVYARDCANIHRGVHRLSQRATERYEAARETVRAFLGAASTREIVFTRGTTESINLVAAGLPSLVELEGRAILITGLEHHSNIVPWQQLCRRTGAKLRVVPLLEDGSVDGQGMAALLDEEVALVAVAHISNALGTILPVESIVAQAREVGALTLIDGAQAVGHQPVDVQALGADFYAFSGHKLFGPTGVGVLHGREELLARMDPYQGGGDMILTVTFEQSTWNELPYKFEAGTPNIAGVIGLGAAIEWLLGWGWDAIEAHEHQLLEHATEVFSAIEGLRLVGTSPRKTAVLSFVLEGIHPHDVGTIADAEGVALRTGHHCAQPVMDRFGIPATTRASLALYNTLEEIDAAAAALRKVQEIFA
ncbi:MAG: cysteine desulfurase [Deltaproteobacteria bacterium]|nr:cysteine desulfurase [Deltaproteobacteria bacterium]